MFNEYNENVQMIVNTLIENHWEYIPSEKLGRSESDVMVESMVRSALMRQKSKTPNDTAEADDIICRLKALFSSTDSENLILQNDAFKQLALDENLFNTKDGGKPELNQYVVTDNWRYSDNINDAELDIVLLINGFPVAIGEITKTTRPSRTWCDAASILGCFEYYTPQMFVTNVFNFATEGNEYRYAAIGTSSTRWNSWRTESTNLSANQNIVCDNIKDMITPSKVMDFFQFFTIFTGDSIHNKTKFIARHHQYTCANMIVDRVHKGYPKKGLIWQSTGSGKTYSILFALLKLFQLPDLNSYTVIVVSDRLDLLSQNINLFEAAGIENLVSATTIEELYVALDQNTYNIITTLYSCFGNIVAKLTSRDNIIVIADECYTSQFGFIGEKMQLALPNAFFFGFTGTPINRINRRNLSLFIADEDDIYMGKYSFSDATQDRPSLPLFFELAPKKYRVKLYPTVDDLFNHKWVLWSNPIDISPDMHNDGYIFDICNDIANHFIKKVNPYGFKAMIVAYDNYCCLEYKKMLDMILGVECTFIIDAYDDNKYKIYQRSETEERELLNRFNSKSDPLKILIVTDKLLSDFDSPILQVMYLVKPLKDTELIQAVSRVGRTYNEDKTHGLIVDYLGVFDETDQYLEFDDNSIKRVITNIEDIKKMFPAILRKCLSYFMGIDRTVDEAESLDAAMAYIPTDNEKDMFALDYQELNQAWNILYPDPVLDPLQSDYIWLTRIYEAAKPTDGSGGLVWKSLGKKTQQLLL